MPYGLGSPDFGCASRLGGPGVRIQYANRRIADNPRDRFRIGMNHPRCKVRIVIVPKGRQLLARGVSLWKWIFSPQKLRSGESEFGSRLSPLRGFWSFYRLAQGFTPLANNFRPCG